MKFEHVIWRTIITLGLALPDESFSPVVLILLRDWDQDEQHIARLGEALTTGEEPKGDCLERLQLIEIDLEIADLNLRGLGHFAFVARFRDQVSGGDRRIVRDVRKTDLRLP